MNGEERSRPRWRYVCLAVWLLVLAAPVAASPPPEPLYALLDARLELMEAVAAYKWHRHLPVENRQREAVVLKQAVDDGMRYGLRPQASRTFFAAQIEAAKQIQRYWFQVWESEGAPAEVPDLNAVVRPKLLRLGSEIVSAAAGTRHVSRAAFDAAVTVEGLNDDAKAAVFEALEHLERFDNRLQQILATGVLRVGTTGDYAPFSYRAGDEEAAGIDVDLAHALAAALGVELALVRTSWPNLLDDLAAGRYDIAMSGVSRTLERQKHGYLSRPYYVGGKTAIARCDRAGEFGSLDSIDRDGVRIIVNPGGTNERFVDARLERAHKVLHADNRTIFDALAAGEADLMITDRIEVELQAARYGDLCATMPGTLSYQEKAYLMPQDGPWQAFVDTWLSLALADGTVARVFRSHGVEPRTHGG